MSPASTSARLRRALLRWDRLLVLTAAALPTLVSAVLGFLWLGERGLLLPFAGGCAALAALVAGARVLARWRPVTAPSALSPDLAVAPDPDWSERETAVFGRVRARIEARTAEAQPWNRMPDLVMEVLREVATGLGGRGVLDFTLPEALLLVERTASRYRARMRRHVPFVDRVSIRTIEWAWTRRRALHQGYTWASAAHRLARIASNPPAAILREVEGLVAGGNAGWLGGQMQGVAQALLLEEVAHAAVELYGGRLRFSDAELLELGLAGADLDRARLVAPDAPLRVLLVGQTGAGKSTMLNALLGADHAETDAAPTTPGFVAHEGEIDGLPCFLVDSAGLDGGEAGLDTLLAEMERADLILWVLRANRPGRAVDQRLLRRFQAAFDATPERQRPEIVAVATGVDRLLPGWPFPENLLPPEAQVRVAEAVQAIGADLDVRLPVPVCAIAPEWNIEALRTALIAALPRAIKAQRNRRRLEATQGSGLRQEVGRAGRGLVLGAETLGGRLLRRVRPGGERPRGSTDPA
ncbi:GTPase family protein [Rubellimicrobium roseum]|uniref:G domain-containing protein n=1 Tax=Rubellimicrobium roseum TaxID=687525 RepID=A0A5C4N9V1_9RHOB|nr:GTPase [Rubellimicrobium roseum]TNC68509.1 hypothetical protein FHG71_14585 [Rubellimicrobium roseum]